MVSVTAVTRSAYYVLKLFPLLLLPLQMRTHLRRAADAFEDQLLQSGLSWDVARELARAYHEANEEVMRQFASPRLWAQSKQSHSS